MVHHNLRLRLGVGKTYMEYVLIQTSSAKPPLIVPITNNFEGYLVVKENGVKAKDKLFFNKDGELEKINGSAPPNKTTINAIALSDANKIINGAYLIKIAVFGNKAISQNQCYLGGFDMELFDENYCAKAVANIIREIKGPIMYKWFLPKQIEDVDLPMGYQRTVK